MRRVRPCRCINGHRIIWDQESANTVGKHHESIIIFLCFALALASPALSSAANEEERQFFDGIQSRNVGPFRGGRAMVAVGVRQDPHVFYMGATGGVWKTENAGASWQVISDDDFGTAAVGAIAVAPSDPNIVVVAWGVAAAQYRVLARRRCL